jgi:DNA polymerase-3 subunit alpha
MSFVHLSCRTHYSIQSGVPQVKEYLEKCDQLGMSRIAITETCNMYSALEAHKYAKGFKCNPIYGAEIWMWPQGIPSLPRYEEDGGWHLKFLIKDRTGYDNLSALITKGIFEGMHYRPRIDFELLEQHHEGLIVTTCGLNGPIGAEMLMNHSRPEVGLKKATENVSRIVDIFGEENSYIELRDFAINGQMQLNDFGRRISLETGAKTIVTNDVRYMKPTDVVTLDFLGCFAQNAQVGSKNRMSPMTDQQYFKTEQEMIELFPNDLEAIHRTQEVADKCQFQFKEAPPYFFPATNPPIPDKKIPESIPKARTRMDLKEYWEDKKENWEYFYKAFPPPKSFNMPNPETEPVPDKPLGVGNMSSYFEWYCKEGLEVRIEKYRKSNVFPKGKSEQDYWDRLEFEMKIIEEMGFPAYMLIVAEFINWSKDNDIPVGPGRGSAAGSLVAWAMGITDIDPLQFNLLFERFLNPERVSMPDIDIDFAQAKRKLAIQHVQEKYGKDLVSQIITYGKLAARAAVKDVCRSLGVNFNASNEIAKMIPEKPGTKLKDALMDPVLQARMKTDPMVNRIFQIAKKVEGTTRQVGIHAAGVVIADRPLVEHAPLYRDLSKEDSMPVVQYDMGSSETIGLIKFDFLGLKTLDQIESTIQHVKNNHNQVISMEHLNLNCNKTYKLLSEGDTVGVFQLESSGMQKLMQEMQPRTIEDVIASIALYRPGPLSSGMDKSFVECKRDNTKIQYIDPRLEKILATTYGSMVYQEQVMQIAQDLSGYSLGEADLLRRAMGKKKKSEMEKQKIRFVSGFSSMTDSVDKNAEEAGEEIFDLMAYFAGYGFNKSHSAAYGMISYQTAWLKAHYRTEYFAALMTIENDNTDKIAELVKDCIVNSDIKILPPNVNISQETFIPLPDGKTILYSLSAIKRIGYSAAVAIVEGRKKAGGKFKDFPDFIEHVDMKKINKKVVENLIKSGAFDWTKIKREVLMKSFPEIIKKTKKKVERNNSMQLSLFGDIFEDEEISYSKLSKDEMWNYEDQAKNELEAVGFYISSHPASSIRKTISKSGGCRIVDLMKNKPSGEYYVGGIISKVKSKTTRGGKDMMFFTLEDETTSVDIVAFPGVFEKAKKHLKEKNKIAIYVEKKMDEKTKKFSYFLAFVEQVFL